jgi:rhamnogalacturonan acetylesterase
MKASNILLVIVIAGFAFTPPKHKPVLYIIGDSTVRNGDGSGRNGQWGWGSLIAGYFDTARINISNRAIGGRSSRTFITEGRWDKILSVLKKGDYVVMQFGHNDAGPLDDTARARGTIKGIDEDSIEIYNPIRKMKEIVHSYGWYMRKYANETMAKGAVAIICSPVPRADWKDARPDDPHLNDFRPTDSSGRAVGQAVGRGKIVRTHYSEWAEQSADETGAYFIDLNERIAIAYEQMDTVKVKSFFPADHTHTNKEGAELNAKKVVEGIKDLRKCKLKKYLLN